MQRWAWRIVAAVNLLFAGIAGASGGMDSGGGGLVQDSQNPWFVQNTKTVRYCLLYDFNRFRQSADVTERAVRRAFQFWQKEFSDSQSIFPVRIEVATQNFVQVECNDAKDPNVDIAFQFGFLTYEQMQKFDLTKINRLAGFSMRTSYNPAVLKGKGYIYIAPDSGPFKFGGQQTVPQPWNVNDGALLYWTLVHELGHVFGVQHSRQTGGGHVMAEDFIEHVTHVDMSSRYTYGFLANDVFKVRARSGYSMDCRTDPMNNLIHLRKFFGFPVGGKCFGFQITANGIEVYTRFNGQDLHVGTALKVKDKGFGLLRDAIHFWLPPEHAKLPSEQRLFDGKTHISTTPHWIEDEVAVYKDDTGTIERQMTYTLDPRNDSPRHDNLKIGGFMDGKLYVNLIEGT